MTCTNTRLSKLTGVIEDVIIVLKTGTIRIDFYPIFFLNSVQKSDVIKNLPSTEIIFESALTLDFNLFRLILTSVLIVSKMFNDTYYTNKYIAQVGGVSLENMNELEAFFMSQIDWELYISTEELEQSKQSIEIINQKAQAYAQR